jgi:hypothetical protein
LRRLLDLVIDDPARNTPAALSEALQSAIATLP